MSFVINPGTVQTPLTAGGVAYGTGSVVKVSSAGTTGQLLVSNGSSVPTWQTVSAAPTTTAVANGSISINSPVIINSDGTISVISGSVSGQTLSGTSSSGLNLGSDTPLTPFVAFAASQNAVVVSYRDNSTNYWTIVAGTVASTGSVTWGTPVIVASNYYDKQNTLWQTNIGNGVSIARRAGVENQYVTFSISGNAVTVTSSVGSIIPFTSVNSTSFNSYNSTNSYIISAQDTNIFLFSSSLGNVSSVVNTTTLNTPLGIQWNSAGTGGIIIGTQSGNRAYIQGFSVSATTITLGTTVTVNGTFTANSFSCAYNSTDNNFLCAYSYYNSSTGTQFLQGFAATLSGSTVTIGSETTLYSGSNAASANQAIYHAASNYYIVYFRVTSVNNQLATCSVSGTTVTLLNLQTNATTSAYPLSAVYDSTNQTTLMIYSNPITAREATIAYSTNLTSTNFLGFSSANYTNGQTATINIVGNITTQSGLTPGLKYYETPIGSLTSSTTTTYGGVALSSTQLLIKG